MKKKVIHVVNDAQEYERQLNLIEGKFTNPMFAIDSHGNKHYHAIIYYEG